MRYGRQQLTSPTRMAILGSMLATLLVPLLSAMPAGCASAQSAEQAYLEGSATYRERVALPPDAVFEAVLRKTPQGGEPGDVLGRAIVEPAGQPPFRFRISYDKAAIQPERAYAVHATVKSGGRVLFTTDRNYPAPVGHGTPLRIQLVSAAAHRQSAALGQLPVSYERRVPGANSLIHWHLDLLPGGQYQLRMAHPGKPEANRFDRIGRWRYDHEHSRLTLRQSGQAPLYFSVASGASVLRQLDAEGKPIDARIDEALRRLPEPKLLEPRLALTGMFAYMSDAATITLCDDGRQLPVAMEADYKALERAYLRAKPQAGEALLVGLDGQIALRPSMEESQPPRATLVVERFQNIWPQGSCGQPLVDSRLRGTYWKLVRLGGEPVDVAAGKREPHLIFAADDNRISGNGGCNRLIGGFELDGDNLRLDQMAGTMMACPAGVEQERHFLQTLGKVERYRIQGSHLEMLDATGTMLARFEAVALR